MASAVCTLNSRRSVYIAYKKAAVGKYGTIREESILTLI
jgi:hypothetical protein